MTLSMKLRAAAFSSGSVRSSEMLTSMTNAIANGRSVSLNSRLVRSVSVRRTSTSSGGVGVFAGLGVGVWPAAVMLSAIRRKRTLQTENCKLKIENCSCALGDGVRIRHDTRRADLQFSVSNFQFAIPKDWYFWL